VTHILAGAFFISLLISLAVLLDLTFRNNLGLIAAALRGPQPNRARAAVRVISRSGQNAAA
jgi:hypothetical protein